MNFLTSLPLIVAVLASSTAFAERIVCYYANWSKYGSEPFLIENIEPTLCTHFVYAFFGLDDKSHLNSLDPWNDLGDDWTEGSLSKFAKLKKQNPSAKFLLGVGGWSEGATNFKRMVSNPESRKAFLNSSMSLIQSWNLDGLEIDWIYQDTWGGTPSDKAGFSALVEEMRPHFQKRKYVLSIATSAHPRVFENSYDIVALSRNVDFINVMTYDLHGSWDGKTGHVAPLHAMRSDTPEERENNVEAIINKYVAKGAAPEKLNVGLVSYGRTFTLFNANNNGLKAPARGPGRVEPLPYRTFCVMDGRKEWEKFRVEEQKVPYAVAGDQWVGYEDVQSLGEKVKFVRAKKLGGVSFWSLDFDDFRGNCGSGKFPLLRSIREKLPKN